MVQIIDSDKEHIETLWSNIDWNKVERYVRRLQDRIYKATDEGNLSKTKSLQRLIFRSYYIKLYAIREVTIKSSGKFTAGIDGRIYVTNTERWNLVKTLEQFSMRRYHPKAIKRVDIPKSNGGIRHLGIPTIYDRIVQYIVKLGMEPEWETRFHENSFGFRPGRSCQDAIELIKDTMISGNGNYILDADIEGCFDNIDHGKLLDKIKYPKTIIEKWLKTGIVIHGKLVRKECGIPQQYFVQGIMSVF